MKPLREDPETSPSCVVCGSIMRGRDIRMRESHDVWEEAHYLEGEFTQKEFLRNGE